LLSRLWLGRRRVAAARRAARRALRVQPSAADGHVALARTFAAEERWGEVLEATRRGLRRAPHDPSLWAWCGVALRALGHTDAARSCFARAPGHGLARQASGAQPTGLPAT
jgi:Flp pilus assembly protein TadD